MRTINSTLSENKLTVGESVMDDRLVNLNEIKGIKLSSVSVKKRPFIKAQREVAKYIIENWDNAEMLSHLVNDKEFKAEQELVCAIAEDRLKELTPAEEKKPIEEPKKKPAKKAGRKVVRKVGDIHKNGLWFWKEYKPGKFDWRVIKK